MCYLTDEKMILNDDERQKWPAAIVACLHVDYFQLFQQCIQKALQQVGVDLTQLEVGRGLVDLHLVLDQIKPRLLTILNMNNSRPSSVADLMKSEAAARLLAIQDEMVSIFCCCLVLY